MVPGMAPLGAFECPTLLKAIRVASAQTRTKKRDGFSRHPVIPLLVSSRFSQHLLQADKHSVMYQADTQRRQKHSSEKRGRQASIEAISRHCRSELLRHWSRPLR